MRPKENEEKNGDEFEKKERQLHGASECGVNLVRKPCLLLFFVCLMTDVNFYKNVPMPSSQKETKKNIVNGIVHRCCVTPVSHSQHCA